MIPVEQYLQRLLGDLQPLDTQLVQISQALDMVAATDLQACLPVPPFTNSAMDGFAVNSKDFVGMDRLLELPVSGDIPAGYGADCELVTGTCMRIMTGAALPTGADAVVKVEATNIPPGNVPLPQTVQFSSPPQAGENVRHQGEDVKVGDPIIRAGEVLTPTALSALVSVGYSQVQVYRPVRVAVLSTGDELRPAGHNLAGAQIPDSNSQLLSALLARSHAQVVAVAHASDDPQHCRTLLDELTPQVDLIVTSGGVSAGAYDVVKQVGQGQHLEFVKVAMQPGKPQGFGRYRGEAGDAALLVALPGNPVSVWVSFHTFVRPILAALTGRDANECLRTTWASAGCSWRSPSGKRQFVPVVVRDSPTPNLPVVHPTHKLGSRSHLVASLHRANGLAVIPEDVEEVEVGAPVALMRL